MHRVEFSPAPGVLNFAFGQGNVSQVVVLSNAPSSAVIAQIVKHRRLRLKDEVLDLDPRFFLEGRELRFGELTIAYAQRLLLNLVLAGYSSLAVSSFS